MQVNVKIKDVKTVHTDGDGRLDQPMIEVTLECNKVGEDEKHEIKFSEMLSNLAGMDSVQLMEYCQSIIEDYAKSAYKGQQALAVTGDWEEQDQLLGKEFTVEV